MSVGINERRVIKMNDGVQQNRKLRSGVHDPCGHVAGKDMRIPKICMRNHECWHCAYDQWIEVMEEAETHGYDLPNDRRAVYGAA
jgi:hypothetical protein